MADKLYRLRINRVAGGVAAGLAEYFNLDIILIRVLFIILTFFNGIGIILYIILWIVVPEQPIEQYNFSYQAKTEPPAEDPEVVHKRSYLRNNGRTIAGVVLIVMGLVFLLENIIPSFSFADVFPVVIIIVGVSLIWNSIGKTDEDGIKN